LVHGRGIVAFGRDGTCYMILDVQTPERASGQPKLRWQAGKACQKRPLKATLHTQNVRQRYIDPSDDT